MKRYCLALGLVADPVLIAEYIKMHESVWPEIQKSIKDAGITNMEIYHIGELLFMIMDTVDNFSFADKDQNDAGNPTVQEWEKLMWKYQKALPAAKPGEKWVLMDKIFELEK